MTLQERAELMLGFARTLYVNGQSTDETVVAAERLGQVLDLRAWIIPRWGELQLQGRDRDGGLMSVTAADPTRGGKDRGAPAMCAPDAGRARRPPPPAPPGASGASSPRPPGP